MPDHERNIYFSNGSYYLNAQQDVFMNCSTTGNPNPICKWSFCRVNRTCENLSDICLSNLTIEATGSVVCNGTNVLGSVSSNATSFVVVPNPSEYEYLASSNNIFQQMPENKINVLQQENSR